MTVSNQTVRRGQGQTIKPKDEEPGKLYPTSITLYGRNRAFLAKLCELDGKAGSTRIREVLDFMEAEWLKRQK